MGVVSNTVMGNLTIVKRACAVFANTTPNMRADQVTSGALQLFMTGIAGNYESIPIPTYVFSTKSNMLHSQARASLVSVVAMSIATCPW